jgi:hypothetical protein
MFKSVIAIVLTIALLAVPAASHGSDDATNPARQWSVDGPGGVPSFTKHVVPLFAKVGCSARSCHGSFQGQNGFRLSLFGYDPKLDHAELTANEGQGPRVDVDAIDESLALRKPLGILDHEGGDCIDAGSWQHRILREWIKGGANYDADNDAYLSRLEVVPNELQLSVIKNESVNLRVIGHFSDDTSEDVTALTNFSTNDESVVKVNDVGRITAVGTGDTSIVVSYGGGVITAQVIVPNKLTTPFPEFPFNNKVDEFVSAKLKKVGIEPSELGTDAQFFRRTYIDSIGTLPTSDEVREFLEDRRPDKRSRAIDRLLQRPEYATYWASIFSDWTGNNPLVLNPNFKVTWLWFDWLEDKFARNLPYDELVGGIITATSREGRPLDEYLAEVK